METQFGSQLMYELYNMWESAKATPLAITHKAMEWVTVAMERSNRLGPDTTSDHAIIICYTAFNHH